MPSETRTSIAAMKILITGASGFIGSHMVEQALQLGHKVWAAVRPTSNRKYLTDERIHFIELDYTDGKVLQGQLQDFAREYGCWDVIIHCAGATRCLRHSDFYTINYEGTRLLVDMLMALDIVPRQFIFMSTLGTYGPIHEAPPYQPIRDVDTPNPNTHYGRSKRKTEEYLMSLPAFPTSSSARQAYMARATRTIRYWSMAYATTRSWLWDSAGRRLLLSTSKTWCKLFSLLLRKG